MGLCDRRRWTASPDIEPLIHTVYSVRITSHIRKNERGVCELIEAEMTPVAEVNKLFEEKKMLEFPLRFKTKQLSYIFAFHILIFISFYQVLLVTSDLLIET